MLTKQILDRNVSMLVLSRKSGQSIVIDGTITIHVVKVDRGRVQLGISAPAEVSIHRQEIYNRILEEVGYGDCSLAASA